MAEFVRAAKEVGLREYGIADHAPMPEEPFDDWRMRQAELGEYISWIEEAKTLAGSDIEVKAGLECDWIEGIESWTAHLASQYDWDYLIGSVHYLGEKWDFDNPLWMPKWEKIDVEEVWTDYWAAYAKMAASGLFDILGHADLIKKFGFVPKGDLSRFYSDTLEAMADTGVALELNTAGWHKPCGRAYPSLGFLEQAASRGIPLCINSDAHAPSELGRDFDRAYALAYKAGYRQLVCFKGREKSFVDLEL